MGKLNIFSLSLLVMVLVTTNLMVAGSLFSTPQSSSASATAETNSKLNNFIAGQKSSSKGGFMNYITKLNPFGGAAKPGEFSGTSSTSSFTSANGHTSGVTSQQTNVNGHLQGSTTVFDSGKASTFHNGHYAGSITCPNCHCHFPLSAGPSCMAQPFGGAYSQKMNSGSSQGSNLVQKIGSTINNMVTSSNNQAAQSHLNSHSSAVSSSNVQNSMSSSNVQNSNFVQNSGNQFVNTMGRTVSAGSFAASNAHSEQSQSVLHSNSFSGSNMQNTNYAANAGSQFTNLAANTHGNAVTGSFATSNTHAAQQQLSSHSNSFSGTAMNQGHMSTGSQISNVVSTAANQLHGVANTYGNAVTGSFATTNTHAAQQQLSSHSNSFSGTAMNQGHMSTGSQLSNVANQLHGGNHVMNGANSMSSSSSSSSASSSSSSASSVVGSQVHNGHHACPSCGGANYNANYNLAKTGTLQHSESSAFATSEHGHQQMAIGGGATSFSGNQFHDVGLTSVAATANTGSLTSNKGSFGDQYIRNLATASASVHSNGGHAAAIAHVG